MSGLLLMLNLGALLVGVLFAYWPQRDSAPADINSDKIRLLGAASPPAASVVAPPPAGVPEAAAGVVAGGAAKAEAPAAPAGPECLTWDSYTRVVHEKLDARLKKPDLAGTGPVISLNAAKGWWAYIPPGDEASARKLLKELKAKKIKRAVLVRTGELRNALSLGVFADQGSAQVFAREAAGQGVKGVLIGPRQMPLKAVLRFDKKPDAAVLQRLAREAEAVAASAEACGAD